MPVHLEHVVIDCAEPQDLARFWCALLGSEVADLEESWSIVSAGQLLLVFQKVPEPKASPKNRLHLDLRVDEPGDIDRAVTLGARRLGPFVAENNGGYQVLADPEGNEFCLMVDPGDTYEQQLRSRLAAPRPA